MPKETQSTLSSREIVRARMYRGIVRQITNDGALVLSNIKMLLSQRSTATCWEVWWASCSLQWPRRVLLKYQIWPSWDFPARWKILEAAVQIIWHQTPDLAATIGNSVTACWNGWRKRDKRQTYGCWVYKTYTLSRHLLWNQASCFYKLLLCSFIVPGSRNAAPQNSKGHWDQNGRGSKTRDPTDKTSYSYSSPSVFCFCWLYYFVIFWAIPMESLFAMFHFWKCSSRCVEPNCGPSRTFWHNDTLCIDCTYMIHDFHSMGALKTSYTMVCSCIIPK